MYLLTHQLNGQCFSFLSSNFHTYAFLLARPQNLALLASSDLFHSARSLIPPPYINPSNDAGLAYIPCKAPSVDPHLLTQRPEKRFVSSTIRFTPVRQSKALSDTTDDPFINATKENQTSFALPLVEQKSGQINLSRRIEFTGFSLVENSMARSPRNDEEWLALSAAFPGASGIQVNAIMIVVRYATLPEKPWPLSAGGLPVFITTDPASPMERKVVTSRPLITTTLRMVYLKNFSRPLFHITGTSMGFLSPQS